MDSNHPLTAILGYLRMIISPTMAIGDPSPYGWLVPGHLDLHLRTRRRLRSQFRISFVVDPALLVANRFLTLLPYPILQTPQKKSKVIYFLDFFWMLHIHIIYTFSICLQPHSNVRCWFSRPRLSNSSTHGLAGHVSDEKVAIYIPFDIIANDYPNDYPNDYHGIYVWLCMIMLFDKVWIAKCSTRWHDNHDNHAKNCHNFRYTLEILAISFSSLQYLGLPVKD